MEEPRQVLLAGHRDATPRPSRQSPDAESHTARSALTSAMLSISAGSRSRAGAFDRSARSDAHEDGAAVAAQAVHGVERGRRRESTRLARQVIHGAEAVDGQL